MKLTASLCAALAFTALVARAATDPSLSLAPASLSADTNANPAVSEAALFGDPTIVKGSGFEIKRSELDLLVSRARAAAAAQGQQIDPEKEAQLEVQFLEELITIQVLLQKVTDADKVAGGQQATLQYSNILKRAGSPEALDRQLKTVGLTVQEWREKGTQESVAMAALQRMLGVFVTDVEVRDYYSNHTSEFEQPETVRAQQLLLLTINTNDPTMSPLDTNTVAAKRVQIEGLLKRARAGEDFTALVKQYSEDLSTRDNGGELPRFARGRLPAEFDAAAFSMTNNQISDVVVVPYGFYLIKTLQKYPAKVMDFAQVSSDIKDFLTHGKLSKAAPALVEKLKTEEQVQILDTKLKSLVDLFTPSTNAPAATAPAQ